MRWLIGFSFVALGLLWLSGIVSWEFEVPSYKAPEHHREEKVPSLFSSSTPEALIRIVERILPPPSRREVFQGCSIVDSSIFYIGTSTQSARLERTLREEGRTEDAELLCEISRRPQGIWITGDRPDAAKRVAEFIEDASSVGRIPVFVLYNVPGTLIHSIGDAIGNNKAWIILEPDALGLAANLSQGDREARLSELRREVEILKSSAPSSRVYIDAGHSSWHSSQEIVEYLKQAGIASADGFSTNVSNFRPLSDEIIYGKDISKRTDGKHFIIDTSRNGASVSSSEWCNPAGAALGYSPTTGTDNALIDAFLWVKPPGESDGSCNGGPSAGKFWLERALGMVKRKY